MGGGEAAPAGPTAAAFTAAIRCWELMVRCQTTLRQQDFDFPALLDALGGRGWWWLSVFHADMLVFQGHLGEAVAKLKEMLVGGAYPTPLVISSLAIHVKLASLQYALNNLSGACDAVLQLVGQLSVLPQPPAAAAPGQQGSSGIGGQLNGPEARRHLHLLPLTRPHCLHLATAVLIQALRQRLHTHDDQCMGHLITLVQVSDSLNFAQRKVLIKINQQRKRL